MYSVTVIVTGAKKKSKAGSEFRKCGGWAAAVGQVKKGYLNR